MYLQNPEIQHVRRVGIPYNLFPLTGLSRKRKKHEKKKKKKYDTLRLFRPTVVWHSDDRQYPADDVIGSDGWTSVPGRCSSSVDVMITRNYYRRERQECDDY